MTDLKFNPFPKIPRLSRDCVITEKIDGTNASVLVEVDLTTRPPETFCVDHGNGLFSSVRAASRTRWISPEDDNCGFARWVRDNKSELVKLGPGHHFGEWWGSKIQDGYGLSNGERRFSLFNTHRWNASNVPSCCSVVPLLYEGPFSTNAVETVLERLRETGSIASPGYMNPEGIVIFHVAGSYLFKKTLKGDEKPKGLQSGS